MKGNSIPLLVRGWRGVQKSEDGEVAMVDAGSVEKLKVHAREILGVRWTRGRVVVVTGCLLLVAGLLGFVGVGVWRAWRAERVYVELAGRGVVLMPHNAESFFEKVKLVVVGQMSSAINTGYVADQQGVLRTPQDVERLLAFPEITSVYLGKCPLTVELVEVFLKMPALRMLHLEDARAGDRELESLTRLPQLEEMGLLKSEISGRGLRLLERFPKLHRLTLELRTLDDEGIAVLSRLPRLEDLSLHGESIDDACVKRLVAAFQGKTGLRLLGLSRTKVTDDGLGAVAGLEQLTALDLSETEITEAGLMKLKVMPRLESVFLMNCKKVSAAGVKAFRKSMSGMQVTTEDGTF